MTDRTEAAAMLALKPADCPFCGSRVRYVESWARSFEPPRLYPELQHVDDNRECPIVMLRDGCVIASGPYEIVSKDCERWNRRAASPGAAPAGHADYATLVRVIDDIYDELGLDGDYRNNESALSLISDLIKVVADQTAPASPGAAGMPGRLAPGLVGAIVSAMGLRARSTKEPEAQRQAFRDLQEVTRWADSLSLTPSAAEPGAGGAQ